MEHLYGLAALVAWNPWVPVCLVIAAVLLRRAGWHLPSYIVAVIVGGAVGLSQPGAGRIVTPPPDCEPLSYLWLALWIGLLTLAAEFPPTWHRLQTDPNAEAVYPDENTAAPPPVDINWQVRLQPWLFALREMLLTVILFLAAAWRPPLTGWLLGLLMAYALAVAGIRLYGWARRIRVERRLVAAAQVGAVAAQIRLGVDPVTRAKAARRNRQRGFMAFIVALGLGAVGWWSLDAAGHNSIEALLAAGMQNVTVRAGSLPQRVGDTVGLQLATEADCLQKISQVPYLWWRLHCAVSMAEFGLDPYRTRRGYFLRTYLSPIDDSAQVYTVWLPDSYDPQRPLPLMVWLHGHTGFRAYHGLWIPFDLWTDQAIVIAPQARGSLDYTGIQMNEVAAAMADVEALYSIDRNRVYLAGHSMGGTGSWYLATQWPDRIAAIAPSSPNLTPWAWGYEPPTGDPVHDDLAVRLQLNEAAAGNAVRLQNVPILASHSDDDRLVPVENSRLMMAVLAGAQPAGPRAPQLYRESQNEGIGHGMSISAEQRLNWLLQFDLTQRPAPAEGAAPVDTRPVPAYGPICRAFDEPFVVIVPDGVRAYADCQPTDNRELALQQIAREIIAFQAFWAQRYNNARPRVMSVSAYLRCQDPRRAYWHPIFLGGPDVNLATAMMIEGDGPFGAWKLPAGFDAREESLTAAGNAARGPAILYAIAPPAGHRGDGASIAPPPFGVVISANDGAAYFQALRRYGVQFGSYALRNRIWFDYALCDAQSFDNTRLIHTYGFYSHDGQVAPGDPSRAYLGSLAARVSTLGTLWPTAPRRYAVPAAAPSLQASAPAAGDLGEDTLTAPPEPNNTGPRIRPSRGDAYTIAGPQPFRYALYEHLPLGVDTDTPLSFNAHAKGDPLHLGGDPLNHGAGARVVLHGVSFGALASVAGPSRADWDIPPGRWRLTGRVGPDFAVYPPLKFTALDALHLPGPTPESRRPVAGFRIRVDGKEVWVSAKPKPAKSLRAGQSGGTNDGANSDRTPPAWAKLEYQYDLELPPGRVLRLETFVLRGNPWELPPGVWADIQLERLD